MRNLILLGLMSAAVAQEPPRYPAATWERSTPEEQGMSRARLDEAFEYARTGPLGDRSWCVSVHRNGYLVAEAYWQGHDAMATDVVWSTSKAVVATLIGVAQRYGLLDTAMSASRWIGEWLGSDAEAITLDMLLRHDSGRYFDLIADFVTPQLQPPNSPENPDPTQTTYAIGLPQQHPAGTVEQYNQMAFQCLERVLRGATGLDIETLSQRELFNPLRLEAQTFWRERSVALDIPNGPWVYGSSEWSCQDLARFGTLWLHKGKWAGGLEVFTEEFYDVATMPNPRSAGSRRYHWSGPPNYRASGAGGQLVTYNPEQQLVITRIGDSLQETGFSGGQFVDMVMESIQGELGTYNKTRAFEEEAAENIWLADEAKFIRWAYRGDLSEVERRARAMRASHRNDSFQKELDAKM